MSEGNGTETGAVYGLKSGIIFEIKIMRTEGKRNKRRGFVFEFMTPLMEHQSKTLLEKYGIKTAACIFSESEDEAVKAAREIGYPVVMKVASPEITHKSDAGGVILNVRSDSEVRDAFSRLMEIDGAVGVNVQPMLERGIEVIVGVTQDEQFGSVIMFGLGGIFVEVVGDVSFRLIPITRRDAEEMVREIRGYRILEGYRGLKGDVKAVVDLLLKVSEIVEREDVLEMDLNPVFVYEKGYAVADARVVVGERKKFDVDIEDISFFFNPFSVAVIGASRAAGKPGNRILENLLKLRYEGKIFPVNPNSDSILGLKCYSSVKDIPESVDVAVIAVPSKRAVEIVEECAEKGVKGIVVISGGFAEGWKRGKEIERKVIETAKKKGIRVVGPNTMGVLDPETGFTSFFSILREIKTGNIGVLSQSGALANFLLLSLSHVGFSRLIAIGNKCDVSEVESLKYLLNDEKTKVVAVYLEGFTNGRVFYNLLKEAKKPIVVLKSGRTEAGKQSALTHTASVSTSEDIFEAVCKQARVARVKTYEELVDTLKALSMQPLPKGRRLAVIEPSGAECVMAADAVSEGGLELAEYTEETLDKLVELAPEWHTIRNPLDLYPLVEKSGDEVFFEVLDIMAKDENVDAIISGIFIPSLLRFGPKFEWLRKYGKPVIITLKEDIEPLRKVKYDIEVSGFPVYPIPERAVRVLKNMLVFSEKFEN